LENNGAAIRFLKVVLRILVPERDLKQRIILQVRIVRVEAVHDGMLVKV